MNLPVLAYGHSILNQKCAPVDNYYPNLEQLIQNMWETMQNANGCGLAAPQVGHAIRLFVVDSIATYESMEKADRRDYFENSDKGTRETFINATIVERSDDYWEDDEGCLSIPGLTQSIKRPWSITIEYYNRNFEKQIRVFSGITARMIQHEYDHTEGILILHYLKPLQKKLLESKLKKIIKGQIRSKYPMQFK